jgi:hypothetical protein
MAREPVSIARKRPSDPLESQGEQIVVQGREAVIMRTLGEIDLDNLSGEVQNAGSLVIWWGILHAKGKSERSRAELSLKTVEATVARDTRNRRMVEGEKVTENIIAELTTLDPDVTRAREEVIKAEEREDMLFVASLALQRKQLTLTNMTGSIARELTANSPTMRHVDEMIRTPHRREQ